ncbi:MAG TPA: VOC family protein [Actinomycetota bacterium]|nr:VOC family protein [Actinomycetota bacterium]
MAAFDVVGLDHVEVTAPEELLDETCEWYRSCLELPELGKPEGTRPVGAWFRAGDHEVHVSVDEHNPHKSAHFALVVTDFDAAVDRLRGSGCHLEQARSIPGRHRCYTRDPAGNRIEIVSFDENVGA